MTEDFKRKLTAIFSTDVVGYSRLMGENEEFTVRTLNKYKDIIFDLIEKNNGRVIDSPGDNVLAEFASVVDAVRCGVQVQEDLKDHNDELPSDRKMEFRVGINIGDVIQDGDRIYGDGVNVAARIESLADPGGICLSRTAYDQVKSKIDVDYEYLGEYEVKNIKDPVRVSKILMDSIPDDVLRKDKSENKFSIKSVKPTIAVLPFLNLSSDPEQEYFVDGLSEEILNSLCQISDLGVAGRTSSFSFKGSNKTIQEITRILNVSNILEGSVRKAGNRLRITAQLVRAGDGLHLWSKNYDRELKDIFEIQEDIATRVANELKVTLGIEESVKLLGGTDNMEAYESYLVAKGQFNRMEFDQALKSINVAISLDSKFALAWAWKSMVHLMFLTAGSLENAPVQLDAGLKAALKAIELAPNLGKAYLALGTVYSMNREFSKAEKAYKKGMGLLNESIDYFEYGLTLHYSIVGYLKKCNGLLEEIRQKDPLHPLLRGGYIVNLAALGEFERAEEDYKRGKTIFGDNWLIGDLYILFLVRFSAFKNDLSKIKVPNSFMGMPFNIYENILPELRRIYNDDVKIPDHKGSGMMALSALHGDPELSLNFLKKYSLDPVKLAYIWVPLYKEVRQLPQFKEFVREIGLVDYWKEYGWPDLCHPVGDDDFECD